jgi:riboflavin synthase
MFTGIIQAVGTIRALTRGANALRMTVNAGALDLSDVNLGDSIAVSGPCLTVTSLVGDGFTVDVSPETLAHTTLGGLSPGSRVNLEKALALSDRLGGHLVSGHVDGVGQVVARDTRGDYEFFRISTPPNLLRYIAHKGSISVEGVSLTVNAVAGDQFELLLIPHTLTATTLGALGVGSAVNLEVDLIARYLERLTRGDDTPSRAALGMDDLRAAGFVGD